MGKYNGIKLQFTKHYNYILLDKWSAYFLDPSSAGLQQQHVLFKPWVKAYSKVEEGTCVSQLLLTYEGRSGSTGDLHDCALLIEFYSTLYQVLSSSVASAMQYYGDDQMKETIRFVTIFDKFFDCLNTRHPREGYVKRKPDLNPYKSPTDKRLKVS